MQHKTLAQGRWNSFSFLEQMAHIGSEVERTIKWKNKDKGVLAEKAFIRALELIDLTIEDNKNRSRLREIVRVREALADHLYFENEYNSTDQQWQKYFYYFTFAANKSR